MRIDSVGCAVPNYGTKNLGYSKKLSDSNVNFGQILCDPPLVSSLFYELFKDGGKKAAFKIIKVSNDLGHCIKNDFKSAAAKWKAEYEEFCRNESKRNIS